MLLLHIILFINILNSILKYLGVSCIIFQLQPVISLIQTVPENSPRQGRCSLCDPGLPEDPYSHISGHYQAIHNIISRIQTVTYKPAANRLIPEVTTVQGTEREMVNTSPSPITCSQVQTNMLHNVKVRKYTRKHAAVSSLCVRPYIVSFTYSTAINMAFSLCKSQHQKPPATLPTLWHQQPPLTQPSQK